MHLRAIHAETQLPALQSFIHQNPLGILTTALKPSSPDDHFIQSSHIPFVLDANNDPANPGVLRGHLARANPQAKTLIDSAARNELGSQEVLVLFNGPVHHYVTPKFYTETKPASGKVVPTWNYSAVQAYGKIVKVYADSKAEESSAFLQRQTEDLTRLTEATMGYVAGGEGEKRAWEVNDAPTNYLEIMKKNILGIEIRLESLGGKFKMSQEMGLGDRKGVIAGFEGLGTDSGDAMAKTVKERGDLKDQQKSS